MRSELQEALFPPDVPPGEIPQRSTDLIDLVWQFTMVGFLMFFAFIAEATHEQHKWAQAIGPCDLPATQLDVLLITRSSSGALYCQPRRR